MSASSHHIHQQLKGLCEDLDNGDLPLNWLEEEKAEEVAATVQLMADVAALLSQSVRNFMSGWDFEEDCRRGRAKEAAAPEAVESGVGA